jgi:hypothetical protein
MMNTILILNYLILTILGMDISKHDFNKAVFHFQDSSTSPEYHRSYVITATDKECNVKVDVYGTVIADTTYQMDSTKFEALKEVAQKLKKAKPQIAKGATGTKTYTIQLWQADKQSLELIWDSLSEAPHHSEAFITMIKSFVPDLDELRKRPFKKN